MSKATNMVMFICIALAMCHFAGLLETTGIGFILGILTDPSSIRTSSFFTIIAASIALVTLGGAVIGLYTAQKASLVVKASIVSSVLFLIGWDLLILWQLLNDISTVLATVLISPMLIVFIIAAVEWWK